MIVSRDGNYSIIDLPKAPLATLTPLNLTNMEDEARPSSRMETDLQRIVAADARSSSMTPNMHGVDWPAMKKKYEPLLAHVNHRADLSYIIGEMISEVERGPRLRGGAGEMPLAKANSARLAGGRTSNAIPSRGLLPDHQDSCPAPTGTRHCVRHSPRLAWEPRRAIT